MLNQAAAVHRPSDLAAVAIRLHSAEEGALRLHSAVAKLVVCPSDLAAEEALRRSLEELAAFLLSVAAVEEPADFPPLAEAVVEHSVR